MANREVLVINGHDYSKYVKFRGMTWTRNDVDSKNSGRVVANATMRREKRAEKRTVPYVMLPMTQALAAQLDDDLRAPTFQATVRDLHGEHTRTFYCSSFKATLRVVEEDGTEIWDDATFNLIEV